MHHYEDCDENGPKVFLGEYASWGNTYYNALVEAAYMTHLERSKVVAMACYAPMLCNVDYVNWKPDMLWFNNHAILKTPAFPCGRHRVFPGAGGGGPEDTDMGERCVIQRCGRPSA